MTPDDSKRLSKFLSYVLRHHPDAIGLEVDAQGWASVQTLIERGAAAGRPFTREEILHVVAINDKKRFSLSEDGQRIRAAQGHSVPVDLGLQASEPPAVLYHGTAAKSVSAILETGLLPQQRQQVHLSADVVTARRVGERHGRAVVLLVDARGMRAAGYLFYRADNGVWLTDRVPPEFLSVGGPYGET